MESQRTGEDPVMAEKEVEQEVIMGQQEEVQAHAQPDVIKVSPGEDTIMEQETVVQAHVQPELIEESPGEDTIMAEKKVEQEIVLQADAQPALIEVSPGENTLVDEKIVEQQVVVQVHSQPELIEVSPGEDTLVDEKIVEQEVVVQVHAQLELTEVFPGEDTMVAEKKVEQEMVVQADAQPELIEVPNGKDPVIAEKKVEPEVVVAHQVEAQVHVQPELIKVSTSVKADKEHKVEDNEVLEVPVDVPNEIQARSTPPETLTVHTTVVEKMLVTSQGLEKKTYSGPPDVVGINAETLLDPAISTNTEPALKPEAHTLTGPIPKPVETPVQASPPEGDTGPVDQGSRSETSSLKFVSAESAANIRIISSEETAPGIPSSSDVQPFVVEKQTSNATGDTKGVVDDFTSTGAPIYKVGLSNVTQEFSDNSSWTTEEEGDSTEEDDLTVETLTPISKPEDTLIVKCEAISDINISDTKSSADPDSEAVRPLDCIKEIRDLVVEVIEVEEVAQHYPDPEEVSLSTQ